MPNHRAPVWVAVAAVLVAVTLGLSGCANPFSGDEIPAAQVGTQASTPTVDGDPGDARLTVAADADPDGWRPDQPIVVNAIAGTISEVTVTTTDGQDVAGAISDDGRHWQTSGTLLPGTTYAVRATMTGSPDTDPVTSSVSISTQGVRRAVPGPDLPARRGRGRRGHADPGHLHRPGGAGPPSPGAERPDRPASEGVEGAWNWVSDTKVQYRTKEYWPARTEVSVTADLAGVPAGADVWGDQNKQINFQIGESVVSVVDVTAHQMTVTIDGEVARTIPVTTGKDGFRTRGGTRVISEKLEDIRMDAASTGITRAIRSTTTSTCATRCA